MNANSTAELNDQWSPDSYSIFAKQYLPMAGVLVQETQIDEHHVVLDVGTGTGNVALTAARTGASVTGVDIAPAMLDAAERRAHTLGYSDISFEQGDVLDLPFDTDRFDVTVSALGHIYADPPETAMDELIRVTRPGGRIGVTSWTPTSLLPTIAGHVVSFLDPEDQPNFSQPPFMWGDESYATERFTPEIADISFETHTLRYPSLGPMHFWEELSTYSDQLAMFLENIDDNASLSSQVIGSIDPYFDGRNNEFELEYAITSGTVAMD